ncbi:MAG: hypothetical protein WCK58_13750, partial [Chloroflexota bacterium]
MELQPCPKSPAAVGSTLVITATDQSTLAFGTEAQGGRLLAIGNRFGTTLALAGWGTTTVTATDASGRATTLHVDTPNSRVDWVQDSADRRWTLAYTGTGCSGDLCAITEPDPDGTGPLPAPATAFTYTASHQLLTVKRDRRAADGTSATITWTLGYDAAGRVDLVHDPISIRYPDRFEYGAGTVTYKKYLYVSVQPIVYHYAVTTYTLDARGRPTVIAQPEGVTTTLGYTDPVIWNATSSSTPSDAGTATTTWDWDDHGNLLTESRPVDATTSVTTVSTYDAATNDLRTRTEADNDASTRTVTRYDYDPAGHLVSENRNCTSSGTTIPGQGQGGSCTGAGTQDASTNVITRYAYTTHDQLASEQDPRGFVTKHLYDTHGNETAVIANCTSSGPNPPSPFDTCTAVFDAGGSSLINAGTRDASTNVLTLTAYDTATVAGNAGLPTSTTDAIGRSTSYTYNTLGEQLAETLPGDTSVPVQTTSTEYDQLGNVLRETAAWTPLVDGLPAVARVTTHVYDVANRETDMVDPWGTVTATHYDYAGNPTTITTSGPGGADPVTTTQTFDDLGQLATTSTGGTTATSYVHNELGAVTTTTAGNGSTATATVDFTGSATTTVLAPAAGQPGPTLATHATFDRLGRETSATDAAGVVTTTGYDRLGRVTSTTSAYGTPLAATTTYAYDRAGNQVSVTDPAGITTTTAYDALGRATAVIVNDVTGQSTLPGEDVTTTTWYDAAGNTVAVTNPLGITTRSILNARDQVARTIANCTDTGTTPTSNPATCTGATGDHTTTANVMTDTTYDGQGNAIKTVVAVGLGAQYQTTTETAYDAAGRVQATKDALGTVTRNAYNGAGQLTDTWVNCTSANQATSWRDCAGDGTVDRVDGTRNLHASHGYDAAGRQVAVRALNGRLTTTVYRADGSVSSIVDNDVAAPSGPTEDVTTWYIHDGLGRQAVVRTASPTGTGTTITRTIFNDDGTVAQVIVNCTSSGTTVPASDAAALACTGAGTKNADTNVITSNTYDTEGRLVAVTAPDPSATTGIATATITTQYAYDDAGRLCRVVEHATGTTDLQGLTNPCTDATQTAGTTTANTSTRYGYDAAGNLTSMTDANGHTTTYGYDAAGHMTSRTDAMGGDLVWTFDALGNRITQRNRTDHGPTVSVIWTYDPYGRILTRTADSTTTTSTYDLAGNRLTATTGTMTITATYDRLGRVLTVDDEDAGTTADTSYTWAVGAGGVSTPSWTDPTGSYTAVLDALDRPTAMTDPVSASGWTFSYGAAGQATGSTQGNGNTVASTFDAMGRELTRTTRTGSTSRAAYTWTHNRAGLALSEASTITGDLSNGTIGYGYDPLGRLTTAGATGYTWDAATNRTGSGASTTAFDAANRPTSGTSPTAAYTSDQDGRLTTRPGQSMTWDHLGRLLSVTTSAGTTTYTYDPLDRLRTVTDPAGAVTRFRYTGLSTSAAQLLDGTGTATRFIGNGWTGERLLDWVPGSPATDRRYHGTNAHHDTTWLADASGAVISSLRYDPWGVPRSAVPAGFTPFRFQGSWHDTGTDLAWVVTRWYAPGLGTFTS